MGIHKLSIQTTRLSHSLLLVMVLATGCGPDDALDPEAKANAEQAYVECMQTRGFEIEHINLSSSDYDVRVVPGDFSRDDLARATVECEELVEPILLGEQTQVEGAEAYYQEFPHQELSVEMSDGTALATTLILPEGDGPFPTLLIRTPYDRKSDFVSVGEFRDAGIVVVVQDVRGQFESEGANEAFRHDGDGENRDGHDTIEWVRSQAWSNGLIAMDGNSASAITAYLAASTGVDGLVAARAEVGTANLYDSVFPGGVFRQGMVTDWLNRFGTPEFLEEIYRHPRPDDFWAPLQTADVYSNVNMAAVHLGGWYDIFGQETIDAFVGYQESGGEGARGKQKLIMGPWIHQNLGEEPAQGELQYPSNSFTAPFSRFSIFAALLTEQFDLESPFSQGDPVVDLDDVPAVQYYVMGDVDDPEAPGNEWRSADSWPPETAPIRWYLEGDGGFSPSCPEEGISSYNFDPGDPSPTICGNNLFAAAGPCDQRLGEARDDTLVFTSVPLEAPLELTGRAQAVLHVDLDQVDADLMVKLSDVYPDGRSMLITEGAARIAVRGGQEGLQLVTPGELVPVEVVLPSTSIILNGGHRLRVSITSSNFPKYQVNPGTGDDFGEFGSGSHQPFEVRLHHSPATPSYLELPVPPSQGLTQTSCE